MFNFALRNSVLLCICSILVGGLAHADLSVGYGEASITPPPRTPSAGYGDRMGRPMQGVHDDLLATAFVIDNGKTKLVLCGVDHLGMIYEMTEAIRTGAREIEGLDKAHFLIGSSHTHAGGGGFMNFPGAFILAGKFSPEAYQLYIDGTIEAIRLAAKNMKPAKIGVGYGHAPGLNAFRSTWPPKTESVDDVALIKITTPDDAPLGAIFNFPAHPTVLPGDNMQFSADWVGYARNHIESMIGGEMQSVFFNGAQGDVRPVPPSVEGGDAFDRCDAMGKAIGEIVKGIWDATETSADLKIELQTEIYSMKPQATSSGMTLPMPIATSEVNVLVLNDEHAFVTMPGEMSTLYDRQLKMFGEAMGFAQVSIFGLTNDAHGYIMMPTAWRHKTYETTVSFGGERYGEVMTGRAQALLDLLVPSGPFPAEEVHPAEVLAD